LRRHFRSRYQDSKILSNIAANQEIHNEYGGVVPELASRAHQQNIIPVVEKAFSKANIQQNEICAIGFTQVRTFGVASGWNIFCKISGHEFGSL
jgi:tRNA A37 threonylcarbamoyltransferase TsaD